VLLGWLSEQDALLVLSGRQTGAPADQEKLAQAAAARDAVAAREPGVDQDDAITDAPAELDRTSKLSSPNPALKPSLLKVGR
jgi:hypothetical protein